MNTLTTERIRDGYSSAYVGRRKKFEAEFDRWLASYEAQVREQIAQEIEVEMRRHDRAKVGFSAIGAYAHAARIAWGQS